MLKYMGLQRVRHNLATEQQQQGKLSHGSIFLSWILFKTGVFHLYFFNFQCLLELSDFCNLMMGDD